MMSEQIPKDRTLICIECKKEVKVSNYQCNDDLRYTCNQCRKSQILGKI